ncbi:MAG: amidohydrolase family protein [Chloroflexi bacterium]|nr:amidohydrolase family protein [Chloroflexota bacterium]
MAIPQLLIRAGQVFTADEENRVLSDAWVRVADGRIHSMGRGEPPVEPGERVIEAPECTLLPGLVDCHVHYSLGGRPDWLVEVEEPYATACWRAARYAEATLRAGFTTVRTLGGRDGMEIALRDGQRSGLLTAPRILAANLVVCMTGGHGNWMGRESDGPAEVRKAVREQLKRGADCIKLMATGGVMTPNMEAGAQQLTYEELQAGVEEAHKAGKRTASHAQGAEGIKAAVLAGIDSVEHGFYLNREIIDLMRERGTYFSATLAAASGIADAPPNTVPEWARAKAVKARDAHLESFLSAYQAGVKMVLGTDAGTPFNFHGANARELSLMVRHGMQPLDALRAATRNGAELLGVLADVGSIEPGKQADLVLVQGDATANVEIVERPENLRMVLQGGRLIEDRLAT